ncbi:hypothetical protein EJB05_51279, partial [Eragrostis curvula]
MSSLLSSSPSGKSPHPRASLVSSPPISYRRGAQLVVEDGMEAGRCPLPDRPRAWLGNQAQTPAVALGVAVDGVGQAHVEVPIPSLKKSEVLVKVEAASINPADWKIQKGMLRPFLSKFPCIP